MTAVTDWPTLLGALVEGRSLTAADSEWAMTEVMCGRAGDAELAGLLVGLRAKGETTDELHGLARAMAGAAERLDVPGAVVDTCGTGGDGASTVNISTLAALLVRGAGERVVKHGNRAASSACGSADLLAELGVVIDLPPAGVARCLEAAGITFCFAPVFHPAMRHAAAARRGLGIPTVFNVLGPLSNPAKPAAQVVGVADGRLAAVVAGVLAERGTSALVVRGTDGLDELSVSAPSQVWAVAGGKVRLERLDPRELGVAVAAPGALRGGDAAHNAGMTRRLLDGETGPVRDAVVLNAAAALGAAAGVDDRPVTDQVADALPRADEALSSGAAGAALDAWVQASAAAR
jgi:anthranilate phosphoribosyltransferase